jgi:Beta-galactosidase
MALKWHPGHYVSSNDNLESALRETESLPFIRGAAARVNWSQIEPAKGSYDFEPIKYRIKTCESFGRQLILLLSWKGFGSSGSPAYLKSDEYDGGVLPIRPKNTGPGDNIKLWQPRVLERVQDLVTALGKEFNGNPTLEAVQFPETSFGQSEPPVTEDQMRNFMDNLLKVHRSARAAMPDTLLHQLGNSPRWANVMLAEDAPRTGVGLAGPDCYPRAENLAKNGHYRAFDTLAGQVPLAIYCNPENYRAPNHGEPKSPQDVTAIYRFARDTLHVNHMIWSDFTGKEFPGWKDVVRMFRSGDFPKDPAGGLVASLPRSLQGKKTSLAPGSRVLATMRGPQGERVRVVERTLADGRVVSSIERSA